MDVNNAKQDINKNNEDFIIHLQYLKDLSFENPNAPAIFYDKKKKPNVHVNIDIGVSKLNDKSYEVVLGAHASAEVEGVKHYIAEIKYAAIAGIVGELEDSVLRRTLMVKVPALILPFVRYTLSRVVNDGGFAALLLDPIDFDALYEKNRQQEG